MKTTAPRVLVLGLGNDILADDAIGLEVAREVARRFRGDDRVEVRETMEMGLALLDLIVDFEALVLVDAIQTGRVAPGEVHDVTKQQLSSLRGRTPHFLGVKDTLVLGGRLGLTMPTQVKILAIEVQDPFTISTGLTPALESAFPGIVDRVVRAVEDLLRPG